MARIRSIHPGLFTDEAFAVLSSDAQMLLIGIWTEADDQGVFEWKPLTLRMRLRPSKDGDVSPMLTELEVGNLVKRFEVDGKSYGAIRNFRKWQRPEKPKDRFPLPDELRSYVHLSPITPQPVADHSPKPQAEEGGRREEVGGSRVVLSAGELEAKLRAAAGWQQQPHSNLFVTGPIEALIAAGCDLEQDVLPIIRRDAPRCRSPGWTYFLKAIAQARDDRIAAGNLKFEGKVNAPNASKQNTIANGFALVDASIAALQRREDADREGQRQPDSEGLPRLRQITA